jgi:uncharacterized protein (TIGR02246 family)
MMLTGVSEDVMRIAIVFVLFLMTTLSATAGPKEEAFAVVEQFKKAYDAADPPAIVTLFAPDAVFLGTLMQGPTQDRQAILRYFQASAAANLPKKVEIENYESLQLSDAAVLFSGQNVFFQTRDGKSLQTPARFTFLIVKGPQGWAIGHFHSSRRPDPQ